MGRKEKARAGFLKDPLRYACSLLEKNRSGKLRNTEQELEDLIHAEKAFKGGCHLKLQGTCPNLQNHPTCLIHLLLLKQTVSQARAAPGPNDVPYWVYESCPGDHKACLKDASYSIRVEQSCHHLYSKREGFPERQPVQRH